MTAQTRRSYGAAVRSLAAAQKTSRGTPAYSRWVNRPLGRRLAALAYCLRLTPNQVTILSAVCTFTAIALVTVLRPGWPMAVLVAALLVLGYALDAADGQLARIEGHGSLAGEWLDHIFDAVKASAFHLAIAVSWFRFYDVRPAVLLIPLGFAVVSSTFFFALMLTDMLRRIERTTAGASGVPMAIVDPGEAAPIVRSLTSLVNDYGLLCVCMLLLGARDTFLVVYGVLFVGNLAYLGVGCLKWFTEMTAADAARAVAVRRPHRNGSTFVGQVGELSSAADE